MSVPQLPHGTGFVCPGAHEPVQAPFTHVCPVHAAGALHVPPMHVCTALPEHWTFPVVQAPASAASTAPSAALASPPLPPLLPVDPEPEPLVASPLASADPVSSRSSMPAMPAHPAPTVLARASPITNRAAAPFRMARS